MVRRPPISTRTDTLFPYTTLFRSNSDELSAVAKTRHPPGGRRPAETPQSRWRGTRRRWQLRPAHQIRGDGFPASRSEEHTSELQSLMRISYAVFCLKKKNTKAKMRTATSRQNY